MTDLRAEARGRDCQIRSSVCNYDNSTVVLAHVRMNGISGMGLKAPDLLGAWACSACHALVDFGRYLDTTMERDDRDLLLLRGVMRTQAQLIREHKLLCE